MADPKIETRGDGRVGGGVGGGASSFPENV